MTEYCGDYGGTNRHDDPCGNTAGEGTEFDSGKCKHHRGTNADGSSHEGNDFAAKHGAWSESFVTDFLREDEIARVKQAEELLGAPESAQDVGKTAAAIALEQFRRTGDDRFLRRYESICDTFNLAPDEEMNLNVDGDVDVSGSVTAEFVTYEAGDGDE